MTPAINLLKKKKIPHEVVKFDHSPNANAYGLEAAEKMAVPCEQVFKTLVVTNDSAQLAVAIVPVAKKLNLKKVAKTLGFKKVAMAEANHVENTTGYILGGVSPLAQKKSLKTVLDDSANDFARIYVSGGRRGVEIALAPSDLLKMTRGLQASITD